MTPLKSKQMIATCLTAVASILFTACDYTYGGPTVSYMKANEYGNGKHTLAELKELMGEPDLHFPEIRTAAYRWEKVSKVKITNPFTINHPLNLDSEHHDAYHKYYIFCVQYDETGAITRAERFKIKPTEGEPWAAAESEIRQWASGM